MYYDIIANVINRLIPYGKEFAIEVTGTHISASVWREHVKVNDRLRVLHDDNGRIFIVVSV